MKHVNSLFIGYLSNMNNGDVVSVTMRSHHHASVTGCRYCSSRYDAAAKWFEQWYNNKLLARDRIKYKIPTDDFHSESAHEDFGIALNSSVGLRGEIYC